jgi:hypothetical protein
MLHAMAAVFFAYLLSFRRDKKKVRRVQGAAPAVLGFALKSAGGWGLNALS